MRRTKRMLWLAPLAALVALAAIVGRAEIGDAAPQAAPRNEAPPTISGTPEEGKTLTAANGRWTGTEPIRYTYSWRRCDADGGSCSPIGGATRNTYDLKKPDVGATLRVRVTATNADGSVNATSVPTAVVRAAAAPAPPAGGCDGNAPIQVSGINLPDRLLIDGQAISPTVVGRSTQQIQVRVHVSCKGKAVQGSRVYVTAVPFNQFTVAESNTGADGWATVTMSQLSGFPAASKQQLLTMFLRAQKSTGTELGGISTRRLISFPVDLRR
jgi:hypothetical protein